MAVAIIKLDNLEDIQESYGEVAGREALRAFAECVQTEVPDNSELMRYSDKELLLMMDFVSYDEFYDLLADVQGKLRWAAERVMNGLELSTSISGVYGYGVAEELTVNARRAMRSMEDSDERLVVTGE